MSDRPLRICLSGLMAAAGALAKNGLKSFHRYPNICVGLSVTCGDDLGRYVKPPPATYGKGSRVTVIQLPAGRALTVPMRPMCSSIRSATRTRCGTTGSVSAKPPSGSARAGRWRRSRTNCSGDPRRSTAGIPTGPGCCPGLDWSPRARLPKSYGSGLGEAADGAGSQTSDRSKMMIDRLIARREVHLREKTLWRMLYETSGRVEEILDVNIGDLDLAGRRCLVKAKGTRTKARPRSGPLGLRAGDRVLGRRHRTAPVTPPDGPHPGAGVRHPAQARPGKVVSTRDICPDTCFARLS